MRLLTTLFASAALLVVAHAQVPSYVPTDGLVGWWPFNGNADDESGNGNNGTTNSAVMISDRFGTPDRALSFDGLTSLVTIPHSASLDITGSPLTISVWVYLPQFQENGRNNNFIYKASYSSGPQGLRCWMNNIGGGSGCYMYMVDGDYSTATSTGFDYTTEIGLGTWKHVLFTNDNTTLRSYVNGTQVHESPTNGTMIGVNSSPLYFGGPNSPNSNTDGYYEGYMDDIGMWNRALTQQEVTALFNTQVPTSHSCGAANVHNTNVQYGTMNDQEGTTYRTVQIGDQVWMAENLMTSHYRNGDPIPTITASGGIWNNTSTGASCWIQDDSVNYGCPYGKLYNWYAAGDSRGVCPSGWHVPSIGEFNTLINELGGSAGGMMKTQGIQYWTGGNLGGSNASGFSGLPAGTRWEDSYVEMGILAHFWSSTIDQVGLVNADLMRLHFGQTNAETFTWDNRRGHSIRCVQDGISTDIGSDLEGQPAIHVYPNPSSGQVMVELELTGLVSLKVIDALGRQVQSEVFQANGAKNRRTMDLSSVAKGIYLVQVQNNGGSVTQTVVIE